MTVLKGLEAVRKRPGMYIGSTTERGLHHLDVCIQREGFNWTQSYVDQKATAPLAKGERTKDTGTSVTFWADASIFETTTYSFETISRRLQEMAFLNKGLTISLRDERNE